MSSPSKPLLLRVRDAGRYRFQGGMDWVRLRILGAFKHRVWHRLVPLPADGSPVCLHIGSGRERLPGWVNVDLQTFLEADVALDVTRGLPFSNVARIFAEHFLEHLPVAGALRFLSEANRALEPDGWIRLSTPNLDWVWRHVYDADADSPRDRVLAGIHANRAFYGWQHKFIWNRELLRQALEAAGFEEVRWCRYGVSRLPEFDGIERHEVYDDEADVPHVLIVEARKGRFDDDRYRRMMELLDIEFLQSLEA